MSSLAVKRETKDKWKTNTGGWQAMSDKTLQLWIRSKQRAPTEMTCIHDTDQSPWYFAPRTHPAAFSSEVLLGLHPICQSVYKRKCPSSIGKTAKYVTEICDLMADVGIGRWNSVKISSVKCLRAAALDSPVLFVVAAGLLLYDQNCLLTLNSTRSYCFWYIN